MSLLILDKVLLGYLKMSTADLTISGKISTIVIELVYVYYPLIIIDGLIPLSSEHCTLIYLTMVALFCLFVNMA